MTAAPSTVARLSARETTDVFVMFPSAEPQTAGVECARRWKQQGYKVAVQIDRRGPEALDEFDCVLVSDYAGYWNAINSLSNLCFGESLGAGVGVVIGDDMLPDPDHTAQEMAQAYLERFPDGFGLMQPAGDSQGRDESGRSAAQRICGSPWFGRGWYDRAYQGKGPCPTHYRQFYGDEELKEVADQLGVLWHAKEYTQFHRHWLWGHQPKTAHQIRNDTYWQADQDTFNRRREQDFPGSVALAAN